MTREDTRVGPNDAGGTTHAVPKTRPPDIRQLARWGRGPQHLPPSTTRCPERPTPPLRVRGKEKRAHSTKVSRGGKRLPERGGIPGARGSAGKGSGGGGAASEGTTDQENRHVFLGFLDFVCS